MLGTTLKEMTVENIKDILRDNETSVNMELYGGIFCYLFIYRDCSVPDFGQGRFSSKPAPI